MKNVFLKKEGGYVKAFYSEEEMVAAGFVEADKIVSDEEFNGNGCYARIIDGEIVVGKTAQEIADEGKNAQLDQLKAELAEIDHAAGAGRAIRAVTLAAAQASGLSFEESGSTEIAVDDDDLTRLHKYEGRAESLRWQIKQLEG